jgi:hypothetical protein
MQEIDRGTKEALASALEGEHPENARMVRDPRTTVTRYPLGLLPTASILRVYYPLPHHPIVFMAGLHSDQAFLLTSEPSQFVALGQADEVTIDRPEAAVAWARAYVETTAVPTSLLQVLSTVDDLEWASQHSAEDLATIQEARARLVAVIYPPRATALDHGFKVVMFVAVAASVQRHEFMVSHDAAIDEAIDVVADRLPLVVGL